MTRDFPAERSAFRRTVEGRPYVAAIDGLRALAVIAVMLYHLDARLLPGGFAGVDVFFVISGYVVTGSLLRDRALPFTGFLAHFYARRLRRIAPALVACLLVTVVASIALIPSTVISALFERTGLYAFFGLSNFALLARAGGYFDPRSEFNPFTHTWSLGVEEQFYLLFPLLIYAWLARPASMPGRVARALFLAACAGSLAACAYWSTRDPALAYYMLPSRFWELGAGAALACLGTGRADGQVPGARAALLASAGAVVLLVTLVLARPADFPFPWALPAVAGTVAIVAAVSRGAGGVVVRVLSTRAMVAIGLMSYSLYLWHWPVYVLLRWTIGLDSPLEAGVAVALTAALAFASYRLVERPFQVHAVLRGLPSRVVVASGLLGVAGAWFAASWLYGHAWRLEQSVVSKQVHEWYPWATGRHPLPASVAKRCDVRFQALGGDLKAHAFSPIDCTAPASRARVFVAGDSHAGAYYAQLHMLAAATGIEVIAYSLPGCAVARFLAPVADSLTDEKDKPACAEFERRVVADVAARAVAGDLVVLASLQIPRISTAWTLPPPGAMNVANAPAPDRLAEEAAFRVVRTLAAKEGVQVALAAPPPLFPAPPFRCADAFNRMNAVCRAGFSVPRAFIEERRAEVMQSMGRLAAALPSVSIWDPLPLLCGHDDCSAFRDGRPLFYDNDHLSGYANELLFLPFLAFVCERLKTGCP